MSEKLCPQCGAPMGSDESKCKYCGEEIAQNTGSNDDWKSIDTKKMSFKDLSTTGKIIFIVGIFCAGIVPIIYGAVSFKKDDMASKKEGKWLIIAGIVFCVIEIFIGIFC